MAIEHVRGRIKNGDRVLLDKQALWLEIVTEPSGMKSWHGGFSPPKPTAIDVGGPYRLELEDGRAGDLLVKRMELGSHKDTVATFCGSGPLA